MKNLYRQLRNPSPNGSRVATLLVSVLALGFSAHADWDGTPEAEDRSKFRPVVGLKGMVVADDPLASEWGAEILRQGGNAVDAAVATAFVMAVTRPHYASLGGGGFLLYCPADGTAKPGAPKCHFIDYREKAPARSTRDMFVKNGKVDTKLSQDSALSSGVPGVTAGLLLALEKFGTMKRDKLLSRAIKLAKEGFPVTGRIEAGATERWKAFNDEAKRIFGCGGGLETHEKPCPPGTILYQPELARVLQAIGQKGRDGFYKGRVAKNLADGLAKGGGIISVEDLAAYEAVLREPLLGKYRGLEVVTAPPPSGGGTGVLQMLRFTELGDSMLGDGYGSAKSIHVMSHAMALAFADRAKWMADGDYYKIPVPGLLDDGYLKSRWKTFKPGAADLSISAGLPAGAPEGTNTTHFSVVDKMGGAVALTTTVNDTFGSGYVPANTGVVMNNEMDDFSAMPGSPNLYGLVGSEANAIAPGKRPLSSMSPTIVRDSSTGAVRLVIGAQGGPRITTSVYQAIVNRLKFDLSLPDAIAAARFHQQWKPSTLRIERHGFGLEVRQKLESMGYQLEEVAAVGRMAGIERFASGRVWGVPDRRAEGAAVAE